MKKIVAAVLLWLVSLWHVQAQETPPEEEKPAYHRFSVGIKGGGSLSFISRTDGTFSRARPNLRTPVIGYTGGLSLQYFAESNFALQVEGFLTQKGWQQSFADNAGNISEDLYYRVALNYLEVPITAHGYIGQKSVRIYLEAGLYLAYLLSYDATLAANVDPAAVTYTMNLNQANRLDLGLRGGAGFEVATAVGTFQIGGSFSYGLGSVLKRYETTADNAARGIPNMLQNIATTITLGYFVEFGK